MRAIRVAIIACGMVLGFLGWPPGTGAQQTTKMPRIGLLVTGPPPDEHACVIAFRRGLTEIGLVEGPHARPRDALGGRATGGSHASRLPRADHVIE